VLNWLDSFFSSAASTIGTAVSNAVHWAVHALASVVFAVFGLVGKAWSALVNAVHSFHAALDRWATEVIRFAEYVIKVVVPRIYRWATAELAKLSSALAAYYRYFLARIADVIDRIAAAVTSVTNWVLAHVWAPLKAYADQIWDDLKKWGYTAWWYITHPQALADLIVMPLVTSVEHNAVAIASQLGQFLLAMLLTNITKVITVIEDIITAVL
jgi:hypothetical protein